MREEPESNRLQRQMTRREFGGILAAAGVINGAPAFLRGQNLNNKLNIAMIACGGRGAANMNGDGQRGGRGQKGEAPSGPLTGIPAENITVLCDVDQEAVDAAAQKFDKPHGFYNGIQIVERFEEEMPVPQNMVTRDQWIGPAPVRPFHAAYLPGPLWYRWWDFGNGTMSDLGGHDNDAAFQVLDLTQPLTVDVVSPMGKAHPELAPATMTVTYEFPARGSAPPVKLIWYQGEDKPSIWKEAKIPQTDRAALFIGDKGMLWDADRGGRQPLEGWPRCRSCAVQPSSAPMLSASIVTSADANRESSPTSWCTIRILNLG